ncbi:TrkH family potassium uptake protein [Agrococcus carbonis]|uniref:Trk-type K+ transport system, membrane component n=1 Tax=Agrococcus carbonis TaxID=684552 RepID=A0A1H1MU83_9MICO|nr:potassium transporter TrkG [Agrococcus carbonis]SDR90270.1 Trk-type K+ transport system, membrane component [Agrococcus carbonis]
MADQQTSSDRSFVGRARDGLDVFASSYPARFAILVFAGLNVVFMLLLMTPWASADGRATPIVDAFFQAVSVVCVTGLTVVDMATHWSPLGNAVVMVGVEVGGIGVLTLASLLGMTVARRLGLRQRLLAASDSNPSRVRKGVVKEGQAIRLGEVGGLLRTVAISVLSFEAALVVLLYPRILLEGKDPLTALYEAVYWSIMAFTNSGFVPTVEGLEPYATDPWFMIVLMLGVFIGSLGFPVYFVLLRHLSRPRQWSLHVKLTISVSVMLFLAGGLAYLVLEWGNGDSWGTRDFGQQLLHAFFLSSMARSGGFAVDDLGLLHNSSLLVTDMLMFVGGGSASTAGGIKVTTLAILFLAAVAEARGRRSMEAFGRRIPSDVLRLAVSVTLWSATIVALVTVVLLEITGAPMSFVLFDVISAFATVGLSTGFTHSGLEDPAKVILALTMFAGRIGSVTLAAALAASQRTQLFTRPEERPIVG